MHTNRLDGEGCSFSAWEVIRTEARRRVWEDRRWHLGLLMVMAMLVLFAKLHQGDLGGYDDAVYAHEGRQMLVSGDWWSVRLNGRLDFDKPPMFVWLEALSMWVLGATDFAARFPAALLGLGSLLLVYLLTRELTTGYWIPIWATMVLLSTHAYMRFAMRAMTDVPFTFFFLMVLYFYLRGLRRPQYFLYCGLALAAGILTRSFLGLIPLGILVGHLLFTRQLAILRSKSFLAGVSLGIFVPLCWFASQVSLHGPEFLFRHFSFTVENFPLTQGKSSFRFLAGMLMYPRLVFEAYWPWLPLMLWGLVLQIRRVQKDRDSTAMFLVLWIVAVVAPLSVAEFKWLRYILPVFPAFAILVALSIDPLVGARRAAILKAVYAMLGLTMAAMWINPKYRHRPEELRRLAPIAEAATAAEQPILLYTRRSPRDAHLFQLIWYTNRNCKALESVQEALSILNANPAMAAITDRDSFFTEMSGPDSRIKILAETESFVCWTIDPPSEAIGMQKATRNVSTQSSISGGASESYE
jgi:4-amino-4-deoxy-L-arabinose transferase-like glycosyltransferase